MHFPRPRAYALPLKLPKMQLKLERRRRVLIITSSRQNECKLYTHIQFMKEAEHIQFRDHDKAGRYIAALDAARSNGTWNEVPELVRKITKHAPQRRCTYCSLGGLCEPSND
jgi:hypothetical protein